MNIKQQIQKKLNEKDNSAQQLEALRNKLPSIENEFKQLMRNINIGLQFVITNINFNKGKGVSIPNEKNFPEVKQSISQTKKELDNILKGIKKWI